MFPPTQVAPPSQPRNSLSLDPRPASHRRSPLGPPQITMPELPAEVVLRIARAAIQGLSPSSRYRILRALCLVSRNWVAPTQELLCRDVVIHHVKTANLWMQSPASERFVAERIELDGRYGQVDAYAAESVLFKAKLGVKRIRVDFVRGLSQRAFCLPNLASESLAPSVTRRDVFFVGRSDSN